jgi:hypothetical protein
MPQCYQEPKGDAMPDGSLSTTRVLKTSVAPFGMLLVMRSVPSPERLRPFLREVSGQDWPSLLNTPPFPHAGFCHSSKDEKAKYENYSIVQLVGLDPTGQDNGRRKYPTRKQEIWEARQSQVNPTPVITVPPQDSFYYGEDRSTLTSPFSMTVG